MKKTLVYLVLLVGLLVGWLGSGTAVSAQTGPDPIDSPQPMPPLPWRVEGLRIDYQRVNVTIEDQVATTHIDQLFINNNDWMLEGTYLFPLPEGAAVSQLTMWVDGQPIEAKILEQAEARQIYDEIVRQLRDPALLEYVGTQAIQANVFPIPPRSERRIEIEYTQILPADNGLIHYVYPQSTDLYTNAPLDEQSIRVAVVSNEEIRAIYSPSHPVAISRDGDFRAVAGYEDANVTADNDFELYYTVSPEAIGLNLLSYRESGQDGFFLLLVAPSVQVDEVVAKDVLLVVDTSGSMEGEKMAQAKEAALYVVEHLNPADRFNVVSFSTGTRSFAPELVPAGEPGSRDFINSLEAIGGTNISQSLLEAVAQADAERPTTIIFLTDGLATEGITDTPLLLDAVKQATPRNVRIFAFGVGNDVDPLLLDSLTQNHRGTTSYVRPFESIEEEVSAFYAKVSMPVLANISLDFDGIRVEQMYPQELPDLFAGTQLVLTGRYRDGGPATITLEGDVNGRSQTFTYRDNNFRSSGGDDFIPRLWATRAIGHLLTEIRLRGEEPELVQSVVNLSIRYGIITPYTSYLIEEDDIFSQTGRQGIANDVVAEGERMMEMPMAEEVVAEAAASADMAAAEAPMALPTAMPAPQAGGEPTAAQPVAVDEMIQLVGSKTFVMRDGVWMDTAFDADTQTAQEVGFASDAYFDLLTAVPDLGQYLAIGEQVLVVYEDQAYQIVPGAGEANITLPEPELISEPENVTTTGGETAVPTVPTTTNPSTINPTNNDTPSFNWGVIVGVLAAVLVGVVLLAGKLAGKRP